MQRCSTPIHLRSTCAPTHLPTIYSCAHGFRNSPILPPIHPSIHPSLSTYMPIHHPLIHPLSHLLIHPSIVHTTTHPSTYPLISNSSITHTCMHTCAHIFIHSLTHLIHPSCTDLSTHAVTCLSWVSHHPWLSILLLSPFRFSVLHPSTHHAFIQSPFSHSVHPIFKTHRLNNNYSNNVSTGSSI